MSARRLMSRFRVAARDKVRALIKGSRSQLSQENRVHSISPRGCGFVDLDTDPHIFKKPSVELELEVGGKQLQVEAKLLYHEALPDEGQQANLLGFEFVWDNLKAEREFQKLIEEAFQNGLLFEQSLEADERQYLMKVLRDFSQ